MKILKTDLQILANHKLSFDTDFEALGQLGWANFLTLKNRRGRPSYLQILKTDFQILANHKLSFDTDFEALGQLGWAT